MKITSVVVLILSVWWSAWAQQNIPVRPYRPDELVSFNPDISISTAMKILNGYSQRFENRLIIKTEGLNKPIGVSVESMHWKRAFEYILRSNMLKYTQHERYYEVEALIETKKKEPKESDITVATREVEINAVFVEMDYETALELGLNWSTFKNGTIKVEAFGGNDVVKEIFRVSGGGTIRGLVQVDALLKAIESRGYGEIIARPQIRVMDGEEGKVKVGKNFFLTLQDFAGNTRFTEYEAGIILTVTPSILGRNDSTFIYLEIKAERSDVQPDVIGVTKRITEGNTQVLLRNGEETVIAGLLSHETKTLRKGVPVLKDLPWWFFGLRYLFGYESKSFKKKEMIIILGARILPALLQRRGTRIDLNNRLNQERQNFKRFLPREDYKAPTQNNSTRRSRRSPKRRR